MRILIAEDDPVSRRLLEAKLVKWGYDVVVTCDGDEAWEALRAEDALKLAILDIMMPGMDGFEVCRRMKGDPAIRDIPVLFISAMNSTEDKIRAFDAGGVDYITKPFADQEVRARVRTHLRLAAAQAELLRINRDLAREIEVRKKAEQKLRASEEMYASIFNNIGIGVSLISPEMEIVSMNPIMKKWFPHIDVSKHPICYASFNSPPRDEVCNYCPTIHTLRDGEVHVAVSDTQTEGGLCHYRIISSPLLSEEGSVSAAIEVVEDITEQKRAEVALHRLNRELRAISKCNETLARAEDEQTLLNEICRIVCDEAGYCMAWVGYAENDDARTIRPVAWAGFEDGYLEQAGLTWADTERGRGPGGRAIRCGESSSQDFATDPQAAPWRDSALQRGYRTGIALPLKDETANAFGALSLYSTEPNAFTQEERRLLEQLAGNLAFGIMVLRARIERERAEEALREKEARLSLTLEVSQAGRWEWNIERDEVFFDARFHTMLGYTSGELPTTLQEWLPYHHPEDLPIMLSKAKTYLNGDSPGYESEHRIRNKAGTWNWVFTRGRLLDLTTAGSPKQFIGFAMDITERKRVEQLNSHLASIVESSDDAIISKTLEGVITSWNAGAERIYGYSADEAVGRPVSILVPTDQVDEIPQMLERVGQGHSVAHYETMRMRKDGRRIFVSLSMSPIRDKSGAIAGVSTIARDITERKRAEEDLRWAYAYNRSLIEASLDPLVTIGPDGLITDANTATEEATGCSWDELVGSDFSDYFTNPEAARSGYQKVFRDGLVRDYPLEVRHRDGHLTPVLYNASVYKDEGGNVTGVFAAARDISKQKLADEERKKLEAQLQQAQKMEAIGLLAGGIAHDFNNILTAIYGYSELIIRSMDQDSAFREYAEQIFTSAERAAELTHGLLAFSRKQVLQTKPLNLCSLVQELERMLGRIVPEDIDFRTTVSDEDLIVIADKGQIGQVLMNLVTNAKDAMPKGGALSIDVFPDIIDENFVRVNGFGEPGKYACISVTDTGHGMDEETCKRIFEPFFTTKEVGKGTGLGMSIVYGIIRQHNGYITVSSEQGKGTTFTIYLSLIAGEMEGIYGARRPEPAPGGTEIILVAEDDETIRELLGKILEKAGYTVIAAVDGRDALDRFIEHQVAVNILVTDVVMPKIDGKRLFEEIRRVRPDMKVLFLSGYTKDLVIERGIPEDEFNYMAKPVMPSDLLKKVREILDRV